MEYKKKTNSLKEIKKDMTIAELVSSNKEAAEKLSEAGLFCGGCPMSQFETIEQGALGHGMDPDKLVKDLNEDSIKDEEYGGISFKN
tara:strand:+ start:11272 stop:11532 length:261 start_codon:yes stop_codon:yes gene_type:complete